MRGGVGWDGSRVGPVRKDLKSEFVAVLVSMLSMLMQVRSKKGGGGEIGDWFQIRSISRRNKLVFNKCIHFVFGSRHSITRLSFLLSYDVLFMMIGTMNHLPWPSEWMRMRKIYPVVLGKKINCSLFQFYLNLFVAVTVRWKCISTNYFSSLSRGVLVSPTVVNKLWEKEV